MPELNTYNYKYIHKTYVTQNNYICKTHVQKKEENYT